jgi:hypothetical protein
VFWKREHKHGDDWMESRQRAIKVLQEPYEGTCDSRERWEMSTGAYVHHTHLVCSRMYARASFYLMQPALEDEAIYEE